MMITLRTLKMLYKISLMNFSISKNLGNGKKKPLNAIKPNEKKTIQSSKQIDMSEWKSQGEKHVKINWKKYGREVNDILESKKQLIDIDLAYLAEKVANNELSLDEQITNALKHHIKMLKEVNFSLLPQLLDLAFSIGIVSPPQTFIKSYTEYYQNNKFAIEENQILKFPSYFLKRVGFQTVMICAGRNMEEAAAALRFFGSILSLNQLKKIDEFCSGVIGKMNLEEIVRFLSIFRQIRKKGSFVERSEQLLVEKQAELTPKSLIMTIISFLQLGNREGVVNLEQKAGEKVLNKTFSEQQVVSLLHVLHKYKAGGSQLWEAIERYLVDKHKSVPFEHLFMVMSGLCRNYKLNGSLIEQLIKYDPTLHYAEQLQDKQFVEFYFVLYAHFSMLSGPLQQKCEALLVPTIKAVKVKSVYQQIQAFFLFLFQSNPHLRKEHLRKAYPDDTLVALLSNIFAFENADIRERDQYEQDLLSRCGPEVWKNHKTVVVAQEFIRYKLVSTMEKSSMRLPTE